MIDKRDKTPQRARESLTSSFHCQAPHFSSSQHARMHSPALPPPRGRTSPNPKHCPTSSLGFHVASSHALLRASASPSDVITPSFFFSFPRDTRCWPCHRRGAWSEHQAGTPSFSIPSRTSFPWRHPTSRRYCQVMHSESSQQDTAQSGTEDAPGIGLKDSGHFPRRSSSVFHGDAGQDGTSVPPRGGTDNDDDDDSPTEPTSFKEEIDANAVRRRTTTARVAKEARSASLPPPPAFPPPPPSRAVHRRKEDGTIPPRGRRRG